MQKLTVSMMITNGAWVLGFIFITLPSRHAATLDQSIEKDPRKTKRQRLEEVLEWEEDNKLGEIPDQTAAWTMLEENGDGFSFKDSARFPFSTGFPQGRQ